MTLQPIIGLEIHVQLKTKSKMFCGCDNKGEEQPPNTTICPICTGQPGVLPVPNHEAIRKTIQAALALNCAIPQRSKFDRKNYFYPDLPKGYQISQYDEPFGIDGFLEIHEGQTPKKIRIQRIHLEEDAAKNFHSPDGLSTFVDFNRAGTPLIEIVSHPDLRSPEDAKTFLQELRAIMRYLNISDADMEKGHLRCDANINLWELDGKKEKIAATPIVEVKNMNSFRSLERAMEYEIRRQSREYEDTRKTIKDLPKTTRGWNDEKGITEPQRTKEEAHDYRYFPEPDIPPFQFSDSEKNAIDIEALRRSLPELPSDKRKRLTEEYGIPHADAHIIAQDRELAEYTEQVISELREWITGLPELEGTKADIWQTHGSRAVKTALNWLIHKLMTHLNRDGATIDHCKITPENFSEFISLIFQRAINSAVAQKVLEIMYETGKDPSTILQEENLKGGTDQKDLQKIIQEVLSENPEAVENYKKGKKTAIMFLMGQAMKKTRGKSDPDTVKKMLEDALA